ncbi:MAG: polysaccharide deacetylase family protein [Acidobacteriota bacterium]|nr:polysaccharide deacetylase family protein [Acidobacteriota bacterium]
MRAISLGYHNISGPEGCPQVRALPQASHYAVARRDFRAHLDAMDLNYALCASLMESNAEWSDPVPLFITFDDGISGSYLHGAAELERVGWRGHFFITTDWLDRPGFMTKEQVRDLYARGHVIGSHTCSHPERMSKLTRTELIREWRDSCRKLSDVLGAQIETASVANGYCSRAVVQAAALGGIRALFTSEPVTRVKKADDCLVLGRYAVFHDSSAARVAGIAAGATLPRLQQVLAWRARAAAKSVLGSGYFYVRNWLLPGETDR